ncbi:MAG: hypothetical protein ACSHX0_06005 [Akkermansiaceae bacterium]
MKLFYKTTFVILAPLAFVSCNKEKSTEVNSSTESSATESATPYSLTTCLVSGKKLGSMGDPYVIVHEGQEIKFCCDGCEPTFKKDPSKYLAKMKSAAEAN